MANNEIKTRIKQRYDTLANWESKNPILLEGEVARVRMEDNTVRTKTGDGTSAFNSLSWDDKNLYDSNTATPKIEDGNIVWGGKDIAGGFGPVDATMVPELGANRFAFLKASCIDIEYSNDGGATWTDMDISDKTKISLFSGCSDSAAIRIGNATSDNPATADSKLRITLIQRGSKLYNSFSKFVIFVSTDGSAGCSVTIQHALNSDLETFIDIKTASLLGWSGYNVINIDSPITPFGQGSSQAGKLRFEFSITGQQNNRYAGLRILNIYGFGGVGWTIPSIMAKTGHIYSYDESQNAIFPSKVKSSTTPNEENDLTNKKYVDSKAAGKLDKVSSPVRVYPGVYATESTDGTPQLITATSDLSYIGTGGGYIPLYAPGGQLKTAEPTSDDSAANKGYVDKNSGKVKDGAITAEKLGASAVETDKLKDGAVTKTKIADGAISEGKFDSELSAAFTGKENSGNKGQPNGYAPLDANGKLPDSYLYGVTVKQYGVRWKGTSSTVCERLGDAVGLTAKAHKGSTESVDNDFDNIYPWSDIKTCNIDVDGNVLAYLGEPSFARDGTNGDVMVEIPKFYYKRVKTGIVEEIWICGTKLPGYELHPLFIDNGKEVSKVFHSVYNASSYTDEADSKVKLQSITGVQPRTRTTRANFRTYARNKGDIWGIEDISCVNALQLLYLVEYANTHSQSVLGSGADSLSYTANHKALEETTNGNTITIASTYKNVYKLGQRIEIGTSQGVNSITTTPRTVTAITTDDETGQTTITFDGDPITIAVGNMMWNVAPLNGSCDALNGKSGWLAGENNYTDHFADVNYRGIEGFHAKLFRFIDGVNIKDRVVYYANSIADYADGVYDGKYRAVGYSNAEVSGYISAFGYDEKAPWVMFPTEAKGGSTTCVPDYYSQNTGERLLALGGNFYNGTAAGAFFFYCFNGFSYSALSYGAHLLVKKP